MILFFNVFVTTKAFTIYDRGELGPSEDRFDVFKYTLASFQPLKWEHVVIYAELDEMYAHRREELESYIKELFPNAIFYPHRNKHQRDWKIAMEKLFKLPSDGLVWFSCNDDHIFIDYETALFERLHAAALRELKTHPHVAIFPFSWAERICYSDPNYVGHEEKSPYQILESNKDYFKVVWGHDDSAQVVSQEVLRKWWFEFDYGDAFKPRTDTGPSPVPGVKDIHSIMPWREISLHYDGSSNVGIDPNAYPPHRIPQGFFENDIKIQFGGDKRLPGYTWFNPDIEIYSAVSKDGVDYRRTLDDIPLFWRSRISQIKVCDERPEDFWIGRRNDAILKTASQFWCGDKAGLIERLVGVFRPAEDGKYHLSEVAEPLTRIRHKTLHKAQSVRSRVAYVLLERYAKQTAFQTVHSLTLGAAPSQEGQIIWVGTESNFDRAMFSRVSKHIVLNDFDLRELATYHKHAAWNVGAAESDAEYLVFSDTLNVFPSGFASNIEKLLGDCDAATIPSRYLTFGPYSDGGPHEPAALIVRREKYQQFSEHARYLGEYGGLDICAAELMASGVKLRVPPGDIFCWRVPETRYLIQEGFRPSCKIEPKAFDSREPLYLEKISRAVLRGDIASADLLVRKFPQLPGMSAIRAVIGGISNPTLTHEALGRLAGEFSGSGQHLAFVASLYFSLGDISSAERMAEAALRADSELLSPQLIKLRRLAGLDAEAAKAACLHLIRMYPLEESLWGMMGMSGSFG